MTFTLNRRSLKSALLLLAVIGMTACGSGAQAPAGGGSSNDPVSHGPPEPSVSPAAPLALKSARPNTNAGLPTDGEITLTGQGFQSGTKIFLGSTEMDVTSAQSGEIKIRLAPADGGSFLEENPGPLPLRALNANGEESLLADGFFLFGRPRWESLQLQPFQDIFDIAVWNGQTYVSGDTGVFAFQNGNWVPVGDQDGSAIRYCPNGRTPVDDCPNCLTPPSSACPLTLDLIPFDPGAALLALESDLRLARFQPSGDLWQEVNSLPGKPLAVKKAGNALYLLTQNGIASSPDGVHWTLLVPGSFDFDAAAYPIHVQSAPFEVRDGGTSVDFFIGSPSGIQYFGYNKGTHAVSGPLRLGPFTDPCGGVPTSCPASPAATALALSDSGTLFSSFVVPPGADPFLGLTGGVGKISIASIASSPTFGQFSLAPWDLLAQELWIERLVFAGSRLLAAGSPAGTPAPPLLYEISLSGGSAPLNISHQETGLIPLPPGIAEVASYASYEDGLFHAFLKTRGCVFETHGAPFSGAFTDPLCFGEEGSLIRSYVRFLLEDSGTLLASTNDALLELDASQIWNPVGPPAPYDQRRDADFSAVGDTTGIDGWPLTCALDLPELRLNFACTSVGTFVRYQGGPWGRFSDEPFLRSLAYDAAGNKLLGASLYKGVLECPMP